MKKKILIVDDEADVRELLTEYFGARGFTTRTAVDGFDAFAKLRKERPDLIILDEKMPRMTGFEFLKKLKASSRFKRVPVIMLTVRSKPEDLGIGIDLGADFYLPKPFKLDNVREFVDIVLLSET